MSVQSHPALVAACFARANISLRGRLEYWFGCGGVVVSRASIDASTLLSIVLDPQAHTTLSWIAVSKIGGPVSRVGSLGFASVLERIGLSVAVPLTRYKSALRMTSPTLRLNKQMGVTRVGRPLSTVVCGVKPSRAPLFAGEPPRRIATYSRPGNANSLLAGAPYLTSRMIFKQGLEESPAPCPRST